MSKHPNHEIIKAYSEDTSIQIEGLSQSGYSWPACIEEVISNNNATFRIKPKPEFVTVGRHTWPMPITMKDVPEDESVWGFSPEYETVQELRSYILIKFFVQNGFAHLTEAEAITHMNAIIAISKGDID